MDEAERARLDQAYRATTYRVGQMALRIGEPDAVLDTLLHVRSHEEWAFLTAWNPRSQRLPDAENRRRQHALQQRLQREGRLYLLGEAIPDSAEWPPEPSVLILGMARAEAEALGRELEQNAILTGVKGGAPELVWLV